MYEIARSFYVDDDERLWYVDVDVIFIKKKKKQGGTYFYDFMLPSS